MEGIWQRLVIPRFRTDAHHLPDEPMLGFVTVPEGEFAMGDQGQPVNVQTFFIARYHTTVAQYRSFRRCDGLQTGRRALPAG